ncbi:MAG: hypothetical protein ACI4XE_02110 [Acutalibacteraceae bacterium]
MTRQMSDDCNRNEPGVIFLNDSKKHRNHRKNENDPYNLGDISDFLYDRFTVMSATECTGLIPSEPQSKAERENYEDIYNIN